MSYLLVASRTPVAFNLRRAELLAIGAALFIQSGAIVVLIAMDGGMELTDSGRALLRQVAFPVYLLSVALLALNSGQFIIAMRRSLWLLALHALPFVSVLWSIAPGLTLRRSVALLFSLLLSYAIAIRTTPAQGLRIVSVTLGLCMALSLGMMAAMPGMAISVDDGALRGVFNNKNVLGWAASISSLAAGVMIYDRAAGQRRLGLWIFFPSLACLLFSGSATGLFAAISGAGLGVFYEMLKKTRNLGRAVLVLVFLQLTALILVFLAFFLTPLLGALGKDRTLTGRVPLWQLVDQQIAARPLLGFGYQAFWSEGNPEAWGIWGQIRWFAPHAHNGYREILLNFGVLGGVLVAILLVMILWRGALLHCRSRDSAWLWPNILMGQLLIINLTESTLLVQNHFQWSLMAVVMLWVLLASSGARHRRIAAREVERRASREAAP
ncbi:O-antigen ligase family protein (plasmid) [Salipiger sp. H15]|uniref:O-antigen ligase family protein n=1 Tax=Alloyangia sp. H15 TaxID=3029062 RepID=A0AAU8AQQ1_9RHOB